MIKKLEFDNAVHKGVLKNQQAGDIKSGMCHSRALGLKLFSPYRFVPRNAIMFYATTVSDTIASYDHLSGSNV